MSADPRLEEAIAIYRQTMREQEERMVAIMRRCYGNPVRLAAELEAEMKRIAATVPKMEVH